MTLLTFIYWAVLVLGCILYGIHVVYWPLILLVMFVLIGLKIFRTPIQ